jgi:hypothetical protein
LPLLFEIPIVATATSCLAARASFRRVSSTVLDKTHHAHHIDETLSTKSVARCEWGCPTNARRVPTNARGIPTNARSIPTNTQSILWNDDGILRKG